MGGRKGGEVVPGRHKDGPEGEAMADTATKAKAGGGGCLGWVAVGIALFGWFEADNLPSSRRVSVDWWETRLYESCFIGLLGAAAVGLGLRAVRVCRPRWVGWVGVGMGGALAVRSAVQIGRWL